MTLYAHIAGSTIDTVSALPRLYFDGTVWHDWRGPGPWRTQPSSAGWLPVTTTPRPADTDTTTHDLTPPRHDSTPGSHVESGVLLSCPGEVPLRTLPSPR